MMPVTTIAILVLIFVVVSIATFRICGKIDKK